MFVNSELGNQSPIKIDFGNESAILNYWIDGLPLKLITHGWRASDFNDSGVFTIKTGTSKLGKSVVIQYIIHRTLLFANY